MLTEQNPTSSNEASDTPDKLWRDAKSVEEGLSKQIRMHRTKTKKNMRMRLFSAKS